MVCHTTLLKSVKRAKMVKARMGVSMRTADVKGIEEPKKVENTLLVHNRRGIRCVWMFTWQDGQAGRQLWRGILGKNTYGSHYVNQRLTQQ